MREECMPDEQLQTVLEKQFMVCHTHYRILSVFCIDSYGNRNSFISSEIDNI